MSVKTIQIYTFLLKFIRIKMAAHHRAFADMMPTMSFIFPCNSEYFVNSSSDQLTCRHTTKSVKEKSSVRDLATESNTSIKEMATESSVNDRTAENVKCKHQKNNFYFNVVYKY